MDDAGLADGDLAGRSVIVTGGAQGQGAALARILAAAGAYVVVGDILEEPGRETAAAIGPGACFVRLDVARAADWAPAVAAARAGAPLRGLVNNAGLFRPERLQDTGQASFEAHYAVNQLGPFLGMSAVIEAMQEAGGGSIVNVSSVAGLRGAAGAFAYAASKWALRGMTKAAALDLARLGIRVNSVHPGPIDTGMLAGRTAEQQERRMKQIPLRRMGNAEEVARLVAFLISDASSYMTGAEISVDGGAAL